MKRSTLEMQITDLKNTLDGWLDTAERLSRYRKTFVGTEGYNDLASMFALRVAHDQIAEAGDCLSAAHASYVDIATEEGDALIAALRASSKSDGKK